MFARDKLRFVHVVRAAVLIVGVLSLAAIAVGVLPGYEIYRDGIVVDHAPAGGGNFTLLMAWVAATGVLAWARPRITFTLVWSGLAWAGMLAFRLFTSDTVPTGWVKMWEYDVVFYLAITALLIVLFVVPLAALSHVTGWLGGPEVEDDEPAAEALPSARVHREG